MRVSCAAATALLRVPSAHVWLLRTLGLGKLAATQVILFILINLAFRNSTAASTVAVNTAAAETSTLATAASAETTAATNADVAKSATSAKAGRLAARAAHAKKRYVISRIAGKRAGHWIDA